MEKEQRPSYEPEFIHEDGVITASMAKELVRLHHKKEKIQNSVFRKIKRSAKHGWRSTTVPAMNQATLSELIRRGFSTNKNNVVGKRYHTIHW